MPKELKSRLKLAAEGFKMEHPEVKKKAREIYKVALDAIEALEKKELELAAYKAPKLFDKTEAPDAEAKKEKRFYGKLERIRLGIAQSPPHPGFLSFLERNGLTLDAARLLVEKNS